MLLNGKAVLGSERHFTMRVYISADMEGITGVTSWDETVCGKDGYEEAREQMNREVAAACRGALEAGADEVVVKDGHETALNLKPDQLPRGTRLIRGWGAAPCEMMLGIDRGRFDCAFFIGYHAEAGSAASPLSHTTEYGILQASRLNGKPMGELDLNVLAASLCKVPPALVTGDQGICRKAEESYPGIRTVAVKEGIGGATFNLHPEEACELIERAAREAVEAGSFRCPEIPEQLKMELTFKSHEKARNAALFPGARRTGDCVVEYETDKAEDLLLAYHFMV